MSKNLKNTPDTDQLFEAVLTLRSVEECYQFFDDLCTVAEVTAFAQRFEVARYLASGLTYAEIETRTGASTATISRISRCCSRGENGYRTVIDRLNKKGE